MSPVYEGQERGSGLANIVDRAALQLGIQPDKTITMSLEDS